jgi:hypothetical protein
VGDHRYPPGSKSSKVDHSSSNKEKGNEFYYCAKKGDNGVTCVVLVRRIIEQDYGSILEKFIGLVCTRSLG